LWCATSLKTPTITRLLDPGHTDDFTIRLVLGVVFLAACVVLGYSGLTS
jgi:hypothetical protein